MIKVELLFGVIAFAVWVFTLVDVLGTPAAAMRNLPKPGWVVAVLLFPLLGTLAWFVFGRPEGPARRSPYERSVPEFPEYDRPGRAAATDSEADEAFLRDVRARAEEQRRRHDEQRRQRDQPE